MIDKHFIDDLSNRISALLPGNVGQIRQDIEANIRTLLQNQLGRLNLVTREEFDVQTALLQRTREKLDQLEQQLQALEQQKQ